MDLKNILKKLKLNESSISMILGAFIIVIVGVLIINYFKGNDEGQTLPESQFIETEEAASAVKGQVHTVVAGETLWSIAEDAYGSGYNWVDIAKENSLFNANLIETGQELSIPDVESKIPTTSAMEIKEARENAISGNKYTVQKGDSLWNIAIRAYGDGYRWAEIAAENNLNNPNVIHTGNILTLPR